MRLLCFSFIILMLFSCSKTNNKRTSLLDYVPQKTAVILKTNNIEGLNSGINNSDFLHRISGSTIYKGLEKTISPLKHLNPTSEILICFSEDNTDSLQYSVITKLTDGLFITDSLPNYTEELINYNKQTIRKHTINRSAIYSTIIDSTFFASSSKHIVEKAFNSNFKDENLEKLLKASNSNTSVSILLNTNLNVIPSLFIEDSLSLNVISKYMSFDLELNQNETLFNGIAKANDSTESLINVFKNTIPQVNKIQNITPSNSDGLLAFTFDDFEKFQNNLLKFQKKDSITTTTNLFNAIEEIGVIYEGENRAIVLNSIDIITTKDALLSEQTNIDTYRDINIYSFSKPNLFANTFSPFISANNTNLYCIIDNYLVFSNSTEMLQNVIANYQNKTTLNTTPYYKDNKKNLSDASSLLQIINSNSLQTLLNKNLTSTSTYKIDEYNASAIQFIYDGNFAHVHGVIAKSKNKADVNVVSEELNIKLENAILNSPQFVINHITKQYEIVLQDIKNNLYLISNKGKILWKKQLQGAILGNIEQIDIYKNGRFQLAFSTPKNVYVLDRNGNEVKPFPLKFNNNITQPLSVFDYDNNKNYRFFVTQNQSVFVFDKLGKTVKGFNFKKTPTNINTQPQHFRIGNKDYVLIKTNETLHILNRRGDVRIPYKNKYSYSNSPVFNYKNSFTLSTSKGDIISINQNGKTSSNPLKLLQSDFLDASSKTIASLNENKLTINNKTIELDFGTYTKPQIFNLKRNTYISITDLQTNKIYVFNSKAKILPNFPIYGHSKIDLTETKNDQRLLTQGDSKSILLYSIK